MPDAKRRRFCSRTALLAALSNLAIQYNFQSIAIALAFMDNTGASSGGTDHNSTNLTTMSSAVYPRTSSESSLLKSLVFAGAVCGQLTMGYLGDVWGRKPAMVVTNALTFIGAIGSALFTWGPTDDLYYIMMACRFILGWGVGGKYPLAATMSSEAESDTPSETESDGTPRSSKEEALLGDVNDESVAQVEEKTSQYNLLEVAKGFFWQTPGAVLPYVVAMLLLLIMGENHTGVKYRLLTSFQFRIILGLGALPALIVVILTASIKKDAAHERFQKRREQDGYQSPFKIACQRKDLWRPLAGCCVCWFIYDFLYYGTTFEQPVLLNSVFGPAETLFDNCWQNIVLNLMGIPGVILAIAMLPCLGAESLQVWGFVAILVSCVGLGLGEYFQPDNHVLNFGLLCCLILSVNWGVNISTYVLPAAVFPSSVRGSLFGLAAAFGKLGALAGGYAFNPIAHITCDPSPAPACRDGLTILYGICAAVILLAILISPLLLPSHDRHNKRENTFFPSSCMRCLRRRGPK